MSSGIDNESSDPSGETNLSVEALDSDFIHVQDTHFGEQESYENSATTSFVDHNTKLNPHIQKDIEPVQNPLSISKYFKNDNDDIFDQIVSQKSHGSIPSAMMTSVRMGVESHDFLNSSIQSTTTLTAPAQILEVQQEIQDIFKPCTVMTTQPTSEVSTTNLSVLFQKEDNADASIDQLSSTFETINEPVICKIFSKDEESASKSFFDSLEQSKMLQSYSSECSSFNDAPIMSTPAQGSIPHFAPEQLRMSTVSQPDIASSFLQSSASDDIFTQALQLNENERSYNAWIPSHKTQKALITMATSPPGTYFPERDLLTMPGVVLEEDMIDAVRELVQHFNGDKEAQERKILTADSVTQDDRGIRELIKCGCYRAAVNLTGRLLTVYAQGAGKAGRPSKHTAHSIQLWFTRISLLVKLHQFSIAEVESEAFGDVDKPDTYFEYYPDLYGARKGSMVPFNFRLLLAELPQYTGKHKVALSSLHYVYRVIKRILHNLDDGLSEDGCPVELSEKQKTISKEIWKSRELRTLYSIANCTLHMKDYNLTAATLNDILSKDPKNEAAILSAMGRLFLQQGDIQAAQVSFNKSQRCRTDSVQDKAAVLTDSALMSLAQNAFLEAYQYFESAFVLQPENLMLVNNMAVCLLYTGNLEAALKLLEEFIQENAAHNLQEQALVNICTLYELQSCLSNQKKFGMLSLVNKYQGDGINISCLKLQM